MLFVVAKIVPVPLSVIVAVPITLALLVVEAVRVNVSPLSDISSFIIATLTSKFAFSPDATAPLLDTFTKVLEEYEVHAVPFQYSKAFV